MIWRVSCRLRHTWIYRSSYSDGYHRITNYECNFCDAKQTTIDFELDRDAKGKHPLCELGLHEWGSYCCCYHTADMFCARHCGATLTPKERLTNDPKCASL
jgi:hypothetical protein